MRFSRRTFLHASTASLLASQLPIVVAQKKTSPDKQKKTTPDKLTGEIGITTGSFMRHLTVEPQPGKLRLLDLPKLMRDELDMRVIDLMTRTLNSFKPKYIDALRKRAEDAGCIISNLKMNQRGFDMASTIKATREYALDEYKRTIDVAQRLGCRWVRPNAGPKRPNFKRYTAGFQILIDYAREKGITLLIENNGWMCSDPEAIPAIIKLVGNGLDAAPDTGNWTDEARYRGLAKAFPLAVTCDFKAYALGPNGEHPKYELKRCFEVAWKSGFRGPWCLEHFNDRLDAQLRGFAQLRDWIQEWSKAAKESK